MDFFQSDDVDSELAKELGALYSTRVCDDISEGSLAVPRREKP